MLEKLTEHLEGKPRRAAKIILTLSVVLILVVAGSMFQLLGIGRYFEPPYTSSEWTPLSLIDNGVRWDNPIMFQGANYSCCAFFWRMLDTGGLSGPLASEYDQERLDSGSPTTVIKTAAQAADMSYWVNLTIFDSTGDGEPGSGDYILFEGPPLQSDFVYTIALVYVAGVDGGSCTGEFSYAIHDGEFYSWMSDVANTSVPWWYRLAL